MKIDDFKKKENKITKFLNKYLGLKYSVIFIALKELPKQKKTATGLISTILIGYTLFFMFAKSYAFRWLVLAYIVAYLIQLIIKIIKKRILIKKSK